MARRGLVLVSSERLCALLQLPEGSAVCGAAWDVKQRGVEFDVEHKDLIDVPAGHEAPWVRYGSQWDKNSRRAWADKENT